jgi:hypothetical protein
VETAIASLSPGGSLTRNDRLYYAMLALGKDRLPPSLRLGSRVYRHVRTIKHDFFAATAFYDDAAGHRVVLKIGRTADFNGIPLRWLGRWLCGRELRFYRRLADLPNVPRLLGTVGDTGFVHAYARGRPLGKNVKVPDSFFAALERLLVEVHQRGIAYVDTNKSPNLLIGDDDQPYLIDFQISWDLHELGDNAFTRWFLRRLQAEDRYHVLKHKRRLRPDELTPAERAAGNHPSPLIRLHRMITKPYFLVRRAIMKRLRESGRVLRETTA